MESEDKKLSVIERVRRATVDTIEAAEEIIKNGLEIISGRAYRKNKTPEQKTREEDLCLNKAEREERDRLRREEKTKYTDEECMNMIKNRCLPVDAPYWVRYQIEKIRLKALADEKHPEDEMYETVKAIERRDRERRKKENEKLRQHI